MKKLICLIIVISVVLSSVPVGAVYITNDNSINYWLKRELWVKDAAGIDGEFYFLSIKLDNWEKGIMVYKDGDVPMLAILGDMGRLRRRVLDDDEYGRFITYIMENEIDALPHWDPYTAAGMIVERYTNNDIYKYVHITDESKAVILLEFPGLVTKEHIVDRLENGEEVARIDGICSGLIDLFRDLDHGEFEISYSAPGELLLGGAGSIWQRGDDIRVFVEEDGEWRRIVNGQIGDVAPVVFGADLPGPREDRIYYVERMNKNSDNYILYASDANKTFSEPVSNLLYNSGGYWVNESEDKIYMRSKYSDLVAFPLHSERPGDDVLLYANHGQGYYLIDDVSPVLIDGTAMAPLQLYANVINSFISVNSSDDCTYTVKSGRKNIVFTSGKETAIVDGEEKDMPQPATIIEGQIYVPLRFMAEEYGFHVYWVSGERAVYIAKDKE